MHEVLKRKHVSLFASYNELYKENAKLRKELTKRDTTFALMIEKKPQVRMGELERIPYS